MFLADSMFLILLAGTKLQMLDISFNLSSVANGERSLFFLFVTFLNLFFWLSS